MKVVAEAFSHKEAPDVRLPLFFTASDASQTAGRAFLKRASVRTVDRDPESGQAIRDAQAKALIDCALPKILNTRFSRPSVSPSWCLVGATTRCFPTRMLV
jgi:hypothetical protein